MVASALQRRLLPLRPSLTPPTLSQFGPVLAGSRYLASRAEWRAPLCFQGQIGFLNSLSGAEGFCIAGSMLCRDFPRVQPGELPSPARTYRFLCVVVPLRCKVCFTRFWPPYLQQTCYADCSATASPETEKANRIEENRQKGVPKPIVRIDNQHDPFATVVDIEYGNELGELLDTVRVHLPKPQVLFAIGCLNTPKSNLSAFKIVDFQMSAISRSPP